MKKHLAELLVVAAAALALLFGAPASAQTVTKQPYLVQNQSWVDAGNGPLEIFPVNGNAELYTSAGTGTGGNGGVSGTSLTLTGTPAVAPCVGCVISGSGITAGTTVTAFNGTTTITISAAMTVQNGTALSWGAACPTTGAPTGANLSAPIDLRATAGGGDTAYPMFTYARLCAYGGQQGGATFLAFTIGAW